MIIDIRSFPVERVNSLTKYPSIPTFHALEGGKLVEPTVAAPVAFPAGPVHVTEKVDGTNGRIVLSLKDYLIGSREEFVYAKDDYIGDKKDGLMDALKPVAEKLLGGGLTLSLPRSVVEDWEDVILAAFFEVYGGRINAWKQYTSTGKAGVRLFDVAVLSKPRRLLDQPKDKIASWRDHGGQSFLDVELLHSWAKHMQVEVVPEVQGRVPFTAAYFSAMDTLQHTYEVLKGLCQHSAATLDEGAGGKPEGIVVRSYGRTAIAKLRLEDYERALRKAR